MYSKIALENVKKSFKDYSIYFLTLTLVVCIFYSFNSIDSQKAVMDLSKSKSQSIDKMLQIISMVSIFASFILGSLIVYANNFLIKKRKKEFGIYMSLGMSKKKISKILLNETFIVGIISLISGLILGIILSQGLSVFTSKLFEASISAIAKTIFYFGIMFILVMILNVFTISKYKIIDLLIGGRKNESIKVKNKFLYIFTFILSLISIISSYMIITKTGFSLDKLFYISIVLGILGTFLMFFSLSGFGLSIISKNKKIYFKDLNIFILRQINSKINTNFISMSIICLMLFLTMVILSTGFSFKYALENSVKNATPFDASAVMYLNKDNKVNSIEDSLKSLNFKFNNDEKYEYYNLYSIKENILDVLGKDADKKDRDILSKLEIDSIDIVKETEYNALRKLENKENISLKNNNVFIVSSNNSIINSVNNILKDNDKIQLENKEYIIQNKKVIEDNMRTSFS